MKRLLITGMVCTFAATLTFAADTTVQYDSDRDRTLVVERGERNWMAYDANELSFDVFGTGTVGEKTLRRPSVNRVERNGRLGLGGGVSYFFHRNIGISGYA